MNSEDAADAGDVLVDGSEILTCTAATMDMLRRALEDELGLDEAEQYGLAPRLSVVEEGAEAPQT